LQQTVFVTHHPVLTHPAPPPARTRA
jgi:hypothetical protein